MAQQRVCVRNLGLGESNADPEVETVTESKIASFGFSWLFWQVSCYPTPRGSALDCIEEL